MSARIPMTTSKPIRKMTPIVPPRNFSMTAAPQIRCDAAAMQVRSQAAAGRPALAPLPARSVEHVGWQAVCELRLEPRRLRRHQPARVRDRHQLFHRRRVERECERRPAGVDEPLELADAAYPADERDARVRAGILDPEQRGVDPILKEAYVEARDRI